MRTANAAAGRTMREFWVAVGLLWLAGVGLRLTILAVRPSFCSSRTIFSCPAPRWASSRACRSFCSDRGAAGVAADRALRRLATLAAGLLIAGVVSGLRGAVLNVSVLYTATIVMSAGIAVMQPALSPLVRQWLPQRVTFGTAIYTNGLLVGETLAVMLTIPLVLPFAGGSWRWALAIWGIPLVLIAILAVALAPRRRRRLCRRRWRGATGGPTSATS